MITYVFLFIITFSIAYSIRKKVGSQYTWALIFVFVPLFLYGALRTHCMDFDQYELAYENAHGNQFFQSVNERYELGFSFLNYIVPSFRMMIFLQTFVFVVSYLYICKKYVEPQYLWLFIFLFFLAGDKTIYFLTAMRNTFAISIQLLALPLILKRKIFWFVAATFLASLFHTSALLFLPLAYIVGRSTKFENWELYLWMGILFFLLVVPVDLLVDQTSVFIKDNTFEKYSSYLEISHESGFLSKIASLLFACFILFDLRKVTNDREHLMLGRLALLYVYFPLAGSLNLRAVHYYCIFILLYAVYLFSTGRKSIIRYAFIILLAVYMGYALFVVDSSSQYSGFKTFKTLLDINI